MTKSQKENLSLLAVLMWLLSSPMVFAQEFFDPYSYQEFVLKYDKLETRFYKEGDLFGGEVQIGRVNLSGHVRYNRITKDFFLSHSQGIEVYNFSLNQWKKLKLVPTDILIGEKKDFMFGHIPGMELKNKKTDIFFGVGPGVRIQEFNQTPYLGAIFRIRVKFNFSGSR